MARRIGAYAGGFLVPFAGIAVLQMWKSAGWLDYEYIPSPHAVLTALTALARTGGLAADVAHTIGVTLMATVVAVTVGAGLGLAVGLLPCVQGYLMSSVDFLRTIPAVTLVPVAVLTVGPGVTSEVLVASYAALWPGVVSTAAGVGAVHHRQYDIAHTLHLSRADIIRKIVLPAVAPSWLVGARLAATTALLVTLVAEMIMFSGGLGAGLIESLNALAPERVWAYIVVCAGIGLALNALLRRAAGRGTQGDSRHGGTTTVVSGRSNVVQPQAPAKGLLPVVTLLVLWQLAGDTDSLMFPPPGTWFDGLVRLQHAGSLGPAIQLTLLTFAGGLLVATVVGSTLGAAIGASRWVDRTLTPTFDALAGVPASALVPVAILAFGAGPLSGVAVVALIAPWPVLLNTAMSMRAIPPVRLDMSRSLRLSRPRQWSKVVLPSLAPGIALGMRVASTVALIVSLLFDIFGTGGGIGRLLVESQQRFDASAVWGLVLLTGVLGYLTSAGLARVSRLLAVSDTAATR